MRSIVGKASRPAGWPSWRTGSGLAVEHLDAAAGGGQFDFVADFAGLLPMDVISEMVGVPRRPGRDPAPGRPPRAPRGGDETTSRPEGWRPPSPWPATTPTWWPTAGRHERDDLTSVAAAAEIDGDRLTDDEMISFLFLLVVAGNETTTKLLGNAWYWGWRNPDQRAKVPSPTRARVPDWVEETLRYDTSTQMLVRVTTGDGRAAGVDIDGERVLLLVGSANRDEEVFEDPERYDLDRDTSELISFGSGRHFCMGAALARWRPGGALRSCSSGSKATRSTRRARGCTPSTCGASPRCPPPCPLSGADAALRAPSRRRPAVVTGASSGIGAGHGRALAGRGHPVVLGARRVEAARSGRVHPGRGRERRWPRLDLADRARSTSFAKATDARRAPSRSWCRAARSSPARHSSQPGGLRGGGAVNLVGAHRLVRPSAPAWSSATGATWSSSRPTSWLTPGPSWRPTWPRSGGSRATSRTLQMELEGTGVRASIVQPGRPSPDGHGLGPDATGGAGRVDRWGLARHGHFLRPEGRGRAIVARSRPRVGPT
jgi:NAD(P)-dependent dehydrogenase (short-subunit alcohol dehydrogenase family)